MNTVYIYELCTGLFLTVMFSNSRFSIINNWTRASESVYDGEGQIVPWQNPLHQSPMTNTLFLFNDSFHLRTNHYFFILNITCSFFHLFLSLSLTPLCFHKYFVFLSFKHLLLNHNHRSSRMFFMIIYTNHSSDLCHKLQHCNQC